MLNSTHHKTPAFTPERPDGTQRATFAAGCFWGIEAAFRELEGVIDTAVGYTGGHSVDPTYEQVCRGGTGHAEAVEVWFDPATVSYGQLLETFWHIHNPTTRNRQGWDVGSQYRSAIFFHDPEQERVAISTRDQQQASLLKPIVTEIVPATAFFRAEEYHQRYLRAIGARVWRDDRAAVGELSRGSPPDPWQAAVRPPARAAGMARAGCAAAFARDADGS